MKWEQVPNLALFRNNTAAFIHELPADSLSNVVGDTDYVLLTESPRAAGGSTGTPTPAPTLLRPRARSSAQSPLRSPLSRAADRFTDEPDHPKPE